ncbi:MAG: hypothetical protein ACTSPL_05830 [Candidatus Odinarchaeia archaeon]
MFTLNNLNLGKLTAYAWVLSILHLTTGILNIATGAGAPLTIPLITPTTHGVNLTAVMTGALLVLIGVIFTAAAYYMRFKDAGKVESGYAYLYTGLILAIIFGILQTLTLAANLVEYAVIMNEDFANYIWLTDFTPLIWLLPLTLPRLIYTTMLMKKP